MVKKSGTVLALDPSALELFFPFLNDSDLKHRLPVMDPSPGFGLLCLALILDWSVFFFF